MTAQVADPAFPQGTGLTQRSLRLFVHTLNVWTVAAVFLYSRGAAFRYNRKSVVYLHNPSKGGRMPLRMRVHDKEPIGMALRRFKKLVERSGMQKELRARQHYEKPCEQRRRAQLRKQKSARRAQEQM